MEAERKAWRENLYAETEAINARTEAIRARTKALRDERTEDNFNACLKETMVCQEETTVATLECQEPSPKEWESEAERQEVPTEEAAVESSRVMKKRHRGRRIAAGRREKPNELT
jgi:hypothetical protein